MRADLQEAFALDNLRLAWRWVRSNPEARFKNYFRGIYRAYSLADEAYLFNLRNRLISGTFQPNHATKVYLPKPSGLLRTYTLLPVEEQIAYQALVNVVAERLFPRARSRYYWTVFGHLYAGKTSVWFYRKWADGYKRFNASIRKAFTEGYVYSASFDLTAFYDTIDHAVLEHFLRGLKLSPEFIAVLKDWLKIWTSTKRRIYHGHGIPQGPLASGLLSEVVLQHFDGFMSRKRRIRYFRYVDDIKLFAKTESELRLTIVYLDILCKEVGLFPQGAKIQIKRVRDIDNELKSVSVPPEPFARMKNLDQKRVRGRIVDLTRGLKVHAETRLKYALSHAAPHSSLNARLLKLLDRQRHLYPQIFSYFSRYQVVPKTVCKALYEKLSRGDPYFSFQAAILECLIGRVHRDYKIAFNQHVRRRWTFAKSRNDANDLQEILLRWQALERMLSFAEIQAVLQERRLDEWARACFLEHIDPAQIGTPSLAAILNLEVKRPMPDVAIVAAKQLLQHGAPLTAPPASVNHVASWGLKIFGLIAMPNRPPSLVGKCLDAICNRTVPSCDWPTVLGRSHDEIERFLILAKGYSKTDVSSWANQMDVVHDKLLEVLFAHDGTIGNYTLGSIGGMLSATSRFAQKYPALFQAINFVHGKRLESSLSHAVTRSTGRPTQHLRFNTLSQARKYLSPGYAELIAKW